MESKYYYIYKITCLCGSLKGHYYFGQHRTTDLNDNYAGSGVIIKQYIKKYGNIEGETYIKEILAFANSPEELNKLEFEIIGDKFKDDPLCINLKCGGFCSCGEYNTFYGKHHTEELKKHWSETRKGCTTWMKGKHFTEEQKQKISESTKKAMQNPEIRAKISAAAKNRVITEETKEKIKEGLKRRREEFGEFRKSGWHHSEEAKRKIGLNNHSLKFTGHKHSEETKKKMSEQRRGKNHPMYGKTGTNAGKKRVYNEDGTYKYVFI